jgi:hypothetical protein
LSFYEVAIKQNEIAGTVAHGQRNGSTKPGESIERRSFATSGNGWRRL